MAETALRDEELLDPHSGKNAKPIKRHIYGICLNCGAPFTYFKWCPLCDPKKLESEFPKWTSGNQILDNFIRKTQLEALAPGYYLEWIEPKVLVTASFSKNGGFGNVYHAIWLDGPNDSWSATREKFIRQGAIRVTLKTFPNVKENITRFLDKLEEYHCFPPTANAFLRIIPYLGVTMINGEYALVTPYAMEGDLNDYLNRKFTSTTLAKRLEVLHDITIGLSHIHRIGLTHGNLHSGNVLVFNTTQAMIGDLGLNKCKEEDGKSSVYGVLPFIAPEVLKGEPYTKASDIYSLGILMWQFASGKRPLQKSAHDVKLAEGICNGLRPRISDEVPTEFQDLIRRCWNPKPESRPTALEVYQTVGMWINQCLFVPSSSIAMNFGKPNPPLTPRVKVHEGAIYTSRVMDFSSLRSVPKLQLPQRVHGNDDNSKRLTAIPPPHRRAESEQSNSLTVAMAAADKRLTAIPPPHRRAESEQSNSLTVAMAAADKRLTAIPPPHRRAESEQTNNLTITMTSKRVTAIPPPHRRAESEQTNNLTITMTDKRLTAIPPPHRRAESEQTNNFTITSNVY